MTLNEEIAALQARIAAAHAERDGWRGSGMQEKYLEAYSKVDALELRLDQLRHEGLRRHGMERAQLQPALAGLEAPLPMPRVHDPDALQREVMVELAITFREDAYHLGPYRYTRFDDAVNYARLLRKQGRGID